jgi:precorrin isomerase
VRSLSISRIEEPQVRDNFKSIEQELNRNPITNGEWKLFDKTFTATGTFNITHRLGFKPLDVIETFNEATVSYDIVNASSEIITVTVTVVGRVRFLLGRMS